MQRRFGTIGAAVVVATILAGASHAVASPPEVPGPGGTTAASPAPADADARPDSPAAWSATTYAGLVFRPQFCLHDCPQSGLWQNRYLLTYGVEVGGPYVGLAVRYGQERRIAPGQRPAFVVHEISIDLRGHYDFRWGRVLVSPFLEFTPMILFGGVIGTHLIVRPGVRVTVLLTRYLDLAVEPFALDIDWYRWERYDAVRTSDFAASLRLSTSVSMHARW